MFICENINDSIKINTIRLFFLTCIIFIIFSNYSHSQTAINNSGKFINKGILKIKSGSPAGLPDSLNGTVEFADTNSANVQMVPNINYRKITFSGFSKKIVDSLRNRDNQITIPNSTDTFCVNSGANLSLERNGFDTKSNVLNKSKISGNNFLRLNDLDKVQEISGGGLIDMLSVDNPNGVIASTGGVKIGKELQLKNGTLSTNNNVSIVITDSVLISRYGNGLLGVVPDFEGKSSAAYYGGNPIVCGNEIPPNGNLIGLYVYNDKGLTLNKNIYVCDSLKLNSIIHTESEEYGNYSITLLSENNPVYLSNDAEINGLFRRKTLKYNGDKNLLNNNYTYIKFNDLNSANGAAEIESYIKPNTQPTFESNGKYVNRMIKVNAYDSNNIAISDGIRAEFGYGWRRSGNPDVNECVFDDFHDAALVYTEDGSIKGFRRNAQTAFDSSTNWAYGISTVHKFGEYAICRIQGLLTAAMKVWLEGVFKDNNMTDYLSQNVKPQNTPPDIYPYNLDRNRQFIAISELPDSVVDWIVIELRESISGGKKFYKTCLLKSNGSLVDISGNERMDFSDLNFNPDSSLYIAFLHRNHLAIVNEMPVNLSVQLSGSQLDLTNPENVLGGKSGMKAIPLYQSNSLVYAMIAGDGNADGVINEKDYEAAWNNANHSGFSVYDYNSDMYINMSDFNTSWNNRGRVSFVK